MKKRFLIGIFLIVFLASMGTYKETQAIQPFNSKETLQQIAELAPEGKVIHTPVQLLFTQEEVIKSIGAPKATFDHQWMYDNQLLLGFDHKVSRLFSIASCDPSVTGLRLHSVKKEFKTNPNYTLLSTTTTQDNRYILEYKHLNRTRVQFTFPLTSTARTLNPRASSYAVISGETY